MSEHDSTAALQAEVATEDERHDVEAEYPPGTVECKLGEHTIHVLPTDSWKGYANTALREGDFETWAEVSLAGDDYDKVWCEADPTVGEINALFDEFAKKTGQDSGKSRAFRRGYRTGRLR